MGWALVSPANSCDGVVRRRGTHKSGSARYDLDFGMPFRLSCGNNRSYNKETVGGGSNSADEFHDVLVGRGFFTRQCK